MVDGRGGVVDGRWSSVGGRWSVGSHATVDRDRRATVTDHQNHDRRSTIDPRPWPMDPNQWPIDHLAAIVPAGLLQVMNPATQSLADGRVPRGQVVVLLIRALTV